MAAFSVDEDVVWEVLVRFGSGDLIGDLRSWVLDCGGGVDIGLCFEVTVDGGTSWKLKWFAWGRRAYAARFLPGGDALSCLRNAEQGHFLSN